MFALIACAAAPDSGSPAPDTGGVDPADTGTFIIAAPSYDAEGVADEVRALLAGGFPDVAHPLADWTAAFEGVEVGAPGCPGVPSAYSLNAPFEGCVADDGRIWAGYAVYAEETDASGTTTTLEADATITGVDGATFLAAGDLERVFGVDGTWSATVVGTWGGSGLPDWTGPEPSVGLWIDGDATTASFFGGLSLDGHAFYLSSLAWSAEAPGGIGELRVRDPSGEWYLVTLDGTGCGDVSYAGTALGAACFDWNDQLAGLVAASASP